MGCVPFLIILARLPMSSDSFSSRRKSFVFSASAFFLASSYLLRAISLSLGTSNWPIIPCALLAARTASAMTIFCSAICSLVLAIFLVASLYASTVFAWVWLVSSFSPNLVASCCSLRMLFRMNSPSLFIKPLKPRLRKEVASRLLRSSSKALRFLAVSASFLSSLIRARVSGSRLPLICFSRRAARTPLS